MKERINQLAALARTLETPADQRSRQLRDVADYTEAYLQRACGAPLFDTATGDSDALPSMAFDEAPGELGDALNVLSARLDNNGQNIASPGFFAFIPSGSLYESALGDFIASVTNRYAGVGVGAPGVSQFEDRLIGWLAELMGYPANAGGDLTSGGSIAALSALTTARESCGISSMDVRKTVIYVSAHTHHCLLKAIRIIGMSECVLREVRCDAGYRMDADALQTAMLDDRKAGLNPWLVIATAGTTNTGSVDPLQDIAQICATNNCWMHVDAAYGGAFMICDEGRSRLQGIQQSDSLMFDPHKGFFIPFGSGAVLIRNAGALHDTFSSRGSYMRDLERNADHSVRSACDYSPELTRPFRGLRLWLPLKLHGLAVFRAALEEKLLLARYFYERMQARDGFVVGPAPDLSVVTFRYVPKNADADSFNQALVDQLNHDRRIYLSSTLIDGKVTLRLAVLGLSTHLDTIDQAIELICAKALRLDS